MSAALKVENLNVTLTYRKASKKLVEDVSFEVHPGECLGILGESGSGKSMTVKSILGLLDKNFQVSGSAVFDGHDLLKESKEEIEKQGLHLLGVVPQDETVYEYDCEGRPTAALPEDNPVKVALKEIVKKLNL